MKRTNWVLALVMAVGPGLCGACSDDDDDDAAPTTEEYCAALAALPEGDGGGPTDAIFEEFGDDPTLAEWAEGLPAAITEMQSFRDTIAGVRPSDELADEYRTAVDAIDRVVGNFEDSRDAAAAGDQAAFDSLGTDNQDNAVPAMFEAIGAVASRCGGDVG
jgi:hypothetical protein